MSDLPRISIVTPSFNHARFIRQTVRSVLEQDYDNLDYLVIDDGSSDNTLDLLATIKDPRCRIIKQNNRGLAAVLERGFRETNSDIMGWVNSDDMLMPGALTKVASCFMTHTQHEFIYGDGIIIDEQGKPQQVRKEINFYPRILLWDFCYILQPGAFWRRSLYQKVGGIDTTFKHCMDYDLWMRFTQYSKPFHLPEFLCIVRFHSKSLTKTQQEVCRLENARIRDNIYHQSFSPFTLILKRCIYKSLRVIIKFMSGIYFSKLPPLWDWMSLK